MTPNSGATRSVTVRLPADLLAKVDEKKRDRRTMTEFIEKALRAATKDPVPAPDP